MSNNHEPTPTTAVDYDPFSDGGALARVVPTTEAQREIWLACQLGGDASLAYNEAVSLRLHGNVDFAALAAAVQDLADRHEALRSTLGGDGQDLFVAANLAVDLQRHDLSALSDEEREVSRRNHAEAEVRTPFNLEHGPLFRARLLILSAGEAELILAAHHIICDGWSFGVLIGDLATLYANHHGDSSALEPAIGYADFAQHLAERSAGAEYAADEAYWLSCYAEPAPLLDLPCDRPRAPTRVFASQRVDHTIQKELLAQLRQLGARNGATLFSTLLTAFGALLQRLAGADEVVIGVPAAGQALPGYEGTVGHGVNLLPMRISPAPAAPFTDSLPAVQRTVLDGFEHQHYTFGTLLRKLVIERDPSRVPLAPVMFNLDRAFNLGGFAGLEATLAGIPRCAENFELFVNAVPQADGSLQLECQYSTALFDAQTVRRWLTCYETLLREICAQPAAALETLEIVSQSDREVLAQLNATQQALPADLLIHQLLMAQARRTPEATAVVCGEQRLSYAALWQQSCRIAHSLRLRGVQRGSRVGLCLPRNSNILPALLGTLLAGATYVPLDPTFPTARLADMAEDADLALLLTDSTAASVLPWPRQHSLWLDDDADTIAAQSSDAPASDPTRDAEPDAPAYMIYTSGSTGKPKGVMVPHRAAVNFLLAVKQRPGLDATDCLLAVTTLSFDIAVLELLLPLTVGASVLLATAEQAADGFALCDLLEAEPVSLLQATPSTWRLLFSAGWQARSGFKALVGGEPLPADLAAQLRQDCMEVWNMYGPTETTVWSSCWQVIDSAAGISIGTPLTNTRIQVLDDHGRLCPIGVPGEIHIGGAGVTLGYWQRPELTAERFVPDPFSETPDARLYRTGDRGRWRNDGLLEHLGRLDFQVKLRGFRIELGDIETHLCTNSQVAQALATVREDTPGDARLVAYVVPRTAGDELDAASLKDYLRERLPAYMLPQHLVPLAALPLLPNGKVDRRALPAPSVLRPSGPQARVAPRNEVEATVLAAMEEVLRLPSLSIHDDFFGLGGHSLLAAKLIARLNQTLDLQLPLRAIFEAPSAEKLAGVAQRSRSDDAPRRPPIQHQPDRRAAPLTAQQERIAFLEELHPGRVTYNAPSAHRLAGRMDIPAFTRAFAEVVQRQPILRTEIVTLDDVHVQRVVDSVNVALQVEDLSYLADDAREAELTRRMRSIIDSPIDIRQAPLWRAALYRLADDEHLFLFMPHHIIWDGWSFDLLYSEMAATLSEDGSTTPSRLPPLPVSYADYAEWQAQWIRSPAFKQLLEDWNSRVEKKEPPKALGTDRPRKPGMSGVGATELVSIDGATTERLRQLARDANLTLNMLTMALYGAMMADLAGHNSIIVGMPVRARLTLDVEPVMGFFNNLQTLHLDIERGHSLAAFFADFKRSLLDLLQYEDVPFECLVDETLARGRSPQAGLYQVLFSFQDARERARQWGALRQTNVPIFQQGATEDLGLWLMELPHRLEGGITYNADIYTEQTGRNLYVCYMALVQRAIADPQQTLGSLLDGIDPDTRQALQNLSVAVATDGPSTAAARTDSVVAPRPLTATEQTLVELWAPLLGLQAEQISPQDNYFDLGGDSLSARRVMTGMHAATGKSIRTQSFVLESLEQLARAYDQAIPQSTSRTGLIRRLLGRLGRNDDTGVNR